MRRRLIIALVVVGVATLALYAGPRTIMIAEMVRSQEERGLDRAADLLAETIDVRVAAGLPVDQGSIEPLVHGDEAVVVRLGDGTEFESGSVDRVGATSVQALADGGSVTMRLAASEVDGRVRDALVPVVLIGSAVLVFAVSLAVILARRLSQPFVDLAGHADSIGLDGDRSAPRSGVPEADHIADALDRSRARIGEVLRGEREFSSNASHQLRTPLAALRLRVEDLSTWPEIDAEARRELDAALVEIDRLASTVTDLLELARSGGIGGWGDIDLGRTAADAVERWQEHFASARRRLVILPTPEPLVVPGSERSVHLVLDVLFENALSHGHGVVEVSAVDLGDRVALRVADEGRIDRSIGAAAFDREFRSSQSTGSGIGLALAKTIAESAGARLHLHSTDPTVFELVLPAIRLSPNC